MELGLLLLLAATAVGVASGGGSGGGDSGGGGGGGGSLLPNLQCGPTNRRGRKLFGRPRTVEPPASCRGRDTGRGAALCDEPGDNYPWEAIDDYLRQSSDIVKRRVENTLKASRISAPNSIRRRRSRSTDDVSGEDVLGSDSAKEKIRAKKHVDSSPARERVTVGKTSPPRRPTTFGPKLEDFTELVYASGGAVQRRPAEAEAPSPTVRTTPLPPTPSGPTPDPYTEAACQYWEEVRSPFYAMNTHNEWKTLINMPNYETYIHMEHCMEEKSQGGCADGCRCTQKYTIRYMPVYDTAANGCDVIYRDKFLFPSHCDCRCLPPGYTLFRKPPAPTTPVPEVVELVEPLPEGWLPERPTGGRKGQVVREEEEDGREGENKEVSVEEVEVEVNERRGEDGEKEEFVKVTEVLEIDEEEKADEAWSPVPSVGSPDKLEFDPRPPGTVVRPQSGSSAERVTPTRAPPPAAIRRHVTVRPRPLLPSSGPQLGSQQPGGRPNTRWQALARRQPGARPSHRNHLRGPPAPLAGARLRRR